MTKEEVEQAFNGVSPYYAYKQGVQDGIAYTEESFRREAAKDAMCQLIGRDDGYKYTPEDLAHYAIVYADALIAKLKEK